VLRQLDCLVWFLRFRGCSLVPVGFLVCLFLALCVVADRYALLCLSIAAFVVQIVFSCSVCVSPCGSVCVLFVYLRCGCTESQLDLACLVRVFCVVVVLVPVGFLVCLIIRSVKVRIDLICSVCISLCGSAYVLFVYLRLRLQSEAA
jgi:hypothetical protein